jgi:hypothetical protein
MAVQAIKPDKSDVPLRASLLIASAAALTRAIQFHDGRLLVAVSFVPAYWLLTATILAIAGVLLPLPKLSQRSGIGLLIIITILSSLANIVQLFQKTAAEYLQINTAKDYRPFTIGLVVFSALIAITFIVRGWMRHVATVAVLMTFAILGSWIIRKSPQPEIDVFMFQRDSLDALKHGRNPYAITFKDIYTSDLPWYAPEIRKNGVVQFGYPYLPLTLFLAAPGQYIAGDFRYAQLAAIVIAAALIAYATPNALSFFAALIFLSMPRIFFVLGLGWTEPFSVMLLAAVIFCAIRCPRAVPYLLGLLLASKQYLPATAPLIFLLASRPNQFWKMLGKAILVAMIVSLPLALWDFHAFWNSAITLQFKQPYRSDSLSFLAWYGTSDPQWTGPAWIAFVVLIAIIIRCIFRCPKSPAGFAAAISLCFLLFFAFNKQAFANYYFFVIGALCCAISALGHYTIEYDDPPPPLAA